MSTAPIPLPVTPSSSDPLTLTTKSISDTSYPQPPQSGTTLSRSNFDTDDDTEDGDGNETAIVGGGVGGGGRRSTVTGSNPLGLPQPQPEATSIASESPIMTSSPSSSTIFPTSLQPSISSSSTDSSSPFSDAHHVQSQSRPSSKSDKAKGKERALDTPTRGEHPSGEIIGLGGGARDRSGTIKSSSTGGKKNDWIRVNDYDNGGYEYGQNGAEEGDLGSNMPQSASSQYDSYSNNHNDDHRPSSSSSRDHNNNKVNTNRYSQDSNSSSTRDPQTFEEIQAERRRSVKRTGGRGLSYGGEGGGYGADGIGYGSGYGDGIGNGNGTIPAPNRSGISSSGRMRNQDQRYKGSSTLGRMEEGFGNEEGEGEKEAVEDDGKEKQGGEGVDENGGTGGVYPPMSEQEAEERAIQENLAHFSARFAARRRAARTSRLFTTILPTSNSTSSSHTSAHQINRNNNDEIDSPPPNMTSFSNAQIGGGAGGSGLNKRGSMLGGLFGRLTGGIGVGGYGVPGMGGGGGKRESLGSLDEEGEVGMGRGGKRDSQLPLTAHAAQQYIASEGSPISRTSSANPFDSHHDNSNDSLSLTRSLTPTLTSSREPQPQIDSLHSTGPKMKGSGIPLSIAAEKGYGSGSTLSTKDLNSFGFGGGVLGIGKNPFGTSSTSHSTHSDTAGSFIDDDGTSTIGGGSNQSHWNAHQNHNNQDQRNWEAGMLSPVGAPEPGWKGTGWRGGAETTMGGMRGGGGAAGYRQQDASGGVVVKEKWWSALCAWGHDLDEGAENAGRTNPME